MFGRRFFGKRFFGSHFFGPASTQTITLSGFASVNAFGSPVISTGGVTIRPAGFANSSTFGSSTLSPGAVTLRPAAFANANAFGSPALHPGPVTITLSGFADADAIGHPILQAVKKKGQGGGNKPGGVAAGQKYATKVAMDEAGLIVALEANANVAKNVNTRMAIYADAVGLPGALIAQTATKTSVVVGSNRYSLTVPYSVLSGTNLWVALHSDGNFNWFLSSGPTSRFNADAFNDGISNPFGPSTSQNTKAPVFLVFLESVTIGLAMTGFANSNSFGSPSFVPAVAQNIALTGFANSSAFGSPELRPVAVTVTLSAFANANAFGSPTLTAARQITLSAFANTNGFGSPTLTVADLPPVDPDDTFGPRGRTLWEMFPRDPPQTTIAPERKVKLELA